MSVDGGHPPRARRVVGIGGSTRAGSKSLAVLATALEVAREAGAEATLADVRALDLPVYSPDRPLAAYPASLGWLLAEVRRADALLLCSPTYHGTISGAVKNVLDALDFLIDDDPPYLGRRVVGLLALGGGSATNTINALGHAVRGLDGVVAPTTVVVPFGAVDEAAGRVTGAEARGRLAAQVGEVLELAERLRGAGSATVAL